MEHIEFHIQKALIYAIGAIGLFAFIAALWGFYFHIGTGTVCILLFIALKHQLKREQNEL